MVIVVDANLKVNFSRSLTFCLITANPNYCGTTCTHISKVKTYYLQNAWWRCKWACLSKQQWNVEAKRSCDCESKCESGWKRECGCNCIQGKIWGPAATGNNWKILFFEALLFLQRCVYQMFVWLSDTICLAARHAISNQWNLSHNKTSQEVRMLSSVTLNCQQTKIVRNLGFQLSELYLKCHKSLGWPLSLLAKVFLNFGELGWVRWIG